ncbi:Mov34/MPN/PAD-1 family protein [Rubrivivax sp. RP6-9]|uniref:Mov34/MPN/PAD-1 family protein n=1 Tax=Rubrivivax sp. RP6-9 TaxID=3415750 RepID=UPI003CC61142
MNDETLLWRPRPPSRYAPTGKVLTVPAQTLTRTAAVLREAGQVESACMWIGTLDEAGHGKVQALVIPMQVNRPKDYSVPGEAMLRVSALARERGWTVVGAIHSHPGAGVEHSRYDDEMTPSRRAVSLVVPFYGMWAGPWPRGLGVHEYFEKYWHLLSAEHANQRVVLSDAPEAQTFDLR